MGANMGTLTATKIKAISNPGKYGDGDGLYLNIAKGGSKSWIQRIVIGEKRKEMGLGGYPAISLARARELTATNRTTIAEGRDPLAEKRKAARSVPTFSEAALQVHQLNSARFKSQKHGKNWIQMVTKYAFPPLGDLPIDKIDRLDVLDVLTPIWTTKQETARRVRQRMRSIFDWATAHGYIETNPAGEGIKGALPAMPKYREHFRALPYQEVGGALVTIGSSAASLPAKLCLRFTVLTGARSSEARGATWAEIDQDAWSWTIDGSRMKGGIEHRVPLSDAALDVLAQAWELRDDSGLVFPSPMLAGKGLSDMTLTKILRSTGLAGRATVHGFRSAFRDWAAENTSATWAAMELSLAHRVGNDVERAYARSDLLEQRRKLMQAWSDFLFASK